jgi:23S rRNA (uracil1939-C5)-methyltransferase
MAKKPKEKREPLIVPDVRLQDIAYGGETVARIQVPQDGAPETENGQGQVVFVAGGLPGELVEAQLFYKKKNFLKANVLRVIEPAPERRSAPCPYFGIEKFPNCGGCQWQHADYAAQLDYKHRILRDQFVRLGGFTDREPPLLPPVGAVGQWAYRNNVEFQVDEISGRPCFHRQNSIRLVPIESCHISHPLITMAIEPLAAALQKHLPKRVHQVTLRVGPVSEDYGFSAEAITALRLDPAARDIVKERRGLLLILRMLGEWDTRDLQPFHDDLQAALNPWADITVFGEGRKRRLESAGGAPYLVEKLHDITYRVPPLAFFQSNPAMAERLITEAMSALQAGDVTLKNAKVLDIYCGVGTFALQMAARGANVLGIEEYEGAVKGAEDNAKLNKLEDRTSFVAAKAEEYILELENLGKHYDAVLVDPPRRGCDPALLESLLKTRPPVIVYVSCDPSTLARDVKILAEGYDLVQSRAVDMFPQTYHMESVSLLRLRG